MKEHIDKKKWMIFMYSASFVIFLIGIAEVIIFEILYSSNGVVLDECKKID